MMPRILTSLCIASLLFMTSYALSLSSPLAADSAPLTSQAAIPSNNIVSTTSTYEIIFNTATAGNIGKIELEFSSGYNVAGATLIEREGVEAGNLSIAGNTIVYTIAAPVDVPANTLVRLELANITNIQYITTDSASVTITTRNTAGTVIDGPTAATVPLKQITTSDVGKAQLKRYTMNPDFLFYGSYKDGYFENALGWDPDGRREWFIVQAWLFSSVWPDNNAPVLDSNRIRLDDRSAVFISLDFSGGAVCSVADRNPDGRPESFQVSCDRPVANGATLNFLILQGHLYHGIPGR
jgi:hypothetical protein